MQLLRAQVLPTACDAVIPHHNFLRRPEPNQFIPNPDLQSRKVLRATTLAPLEIDVAKSRILAGFPPVLFDCIQLAADRAIDAMRRNDDATAQAQRLTHIALPQANGIRVCQRSEAVVEQNLLERHILSLRVASTAVAQENI